MGFHKNGAVQGFLEGDILGTFGELAGKALILRIHRDISWGDYFSSGCKIDSKQRNRR